MHNDRYLVWIVILGTVVLLNLPLPASLRVKSGVQDSAAVFQNGMSLVIQRLREWAAFMGDAKARVAERAALQERVAMLQERVRELERVVDESAELRRQAGYATSAEFKLVPCRVVFRGDTSGWWQTMRLNRGGADGVGTNMAVITTDGLVGRTTTVSARSCEVLLVTDPNCKVSCRIRRTGAFGILRGMGMSPGGTGRAEMLSASGAFRLEYVPKESEMRVGDEVVTSGLGGVFPEGLLVGRVTRQRLDVSGMYQRADVMPAADMASLRYVFVVAGKAAAKEERRP
ncbi:MAG: rod shape-determining protein MreC [Lentisphaerae bacterium]|nr:rod shape-determining protein MreC [Lentisphaerota bacterium]